MAKAKKKRSPAERARRKFSADVYARVRVAMRGVQVQVREQLRDARVELREATAQAKKCNVAPGQYVAKPRDLASEEGLRWLSYLRLLAAQNEVHTLVNVLHDVTPTRDRDGGVDLFLDEATSRSSFTYVDDWATWREALRARQDALRTKAKRGT